MFKIAGSEHYFTNVAVKVPDGNGKYILHKFDAKFRRLSTTEIDEVYRRINKDKLRENEELLSDTELLHDVMVGWRGVLDQDGNEIEFTPENLDKLLEVFPVRPTLAQAWFDSLQAGKQKN